MRNIDRYVHLTILKPKLFNKKSEVRYRILLATGLPAHVTPVNTDLPPMPHLWGIDAIQTHTEPGAIMCDEVNRIPIGDLLDESLDGANVCMGRLGKDKDKKEDKKEGKP